MNLGPTDDNYYNFWTLILPRLFVFLIANKKQLHNIHYKLLKNMILNLNSSVLLAQLVNISHYHIPNNDLLSFNSCNIT